MNRVQIIADDYGLSGSVNRGIEELASGGQIDGVSIMAHSNADLSTVHRLSDAPVELGVHLVFVGETPLLPIGRPPVNYRSLLWKLLQRPSFAAALADEAAAQIAVLKQRGLRLTFLNSHQHVHVFPPLWRALRPLLEREGLRVRISRRLGRAPTKQLLVDLAGSVSWMLWPLSNCETAAPIGIEVAGNFDQCAASRLGKRLRRSHRADCVELVVHPGHEDAELRSRYAQWGYHWANEYRVLAAGGVRRALCVAAAG